MIQGGISYAGSALSGWLLGYDGSADGATLDLNDTTIFSSTTASQRMPRIKGCKLSESSMAAVWRTSNTSLVVAIITFDVGGVPTIGSEVTVSTGSSGIQAFDVARLSDTKFAIAVSKNGAGGSPSGTGTYVRTYTVSGTTPTLDATYTYSSSVELSVAVAFSSATVGAVLVSNGADMEIIGLTAGAGTLVARGAADTETRLSSTYDGNATLKVAGGGFIASWVDYNSSLFTFYDVVMSVADSGSAVTFGTLGRISIIDHTSDPNLNEAGMFHIANSVVNANGSAGVVTRGGAVDAASGLGCPLWRTMVFHNDSGTIEPAGSTNTSPAYYAFRGESALAQLITSDFVEAGVDINGTSYDVFLGAFYEQSVGAGGNGGYVDFKIRAFALPSSPADWEAARGVLMGLHASAFVNATDDFYLAISSTVSANMIEGLTGSCIVALSADRAVFLCEGENNDLSCKVINKG